VGLKIVISGKRLAAFYFLCLVVALICIGLSPISPWRALGLLIKEYYVVPLLLVIMGHMSIRFSNDMDALAMKVLFYIWFYPFVLMSFCGVAFAYNQWGDANEEKLFAMTIEQVNYYKLKRRGDDEIFAEGSPEYIKAVQRAQFDEGSRSMGRRHTKFAVIVKNPIKSEVSNYLETIA
jgi:hypothetical protein